MLSPGLAVLVLQILLYLCGAYPVSGIGFAMLPKPVMKLLLPMMLFLSSIFCRESRGLHLSQPLYEDSNSTLNLPS